MAIKVASVQETREIEAAVDRELMSYACMMRRAGEAASDALQREIAMDAETHVTFLIGKGNNGGDGLVMALDLARKTEAQIKLVLLEARAEGDPLLPVAREANLGISRAADVSHKDLEALARSSDIIVDALFGIGLRLPLPDKAKRVLQAMKPGLDPEPADDSAPQTLTTVAPSRERKAGPFVFALDCPSGVDCGSGAVDPHALPADMTISFIAAKPGLFAFPGAAAVGDLIVCDLGIPPDFPALSRNRRFVVVAKLARDLAPRRPLDGHKGAFGKVLIIAGCPNYIGAIALAGEAAGRSGVGLVTVGAAQQQINIVAGSLREPTWLPLPDENGAIAGPGAKIVAEAARGYQALLLGPGLGLHRATRQFVSRLLRADDLPPLILDADALNCLSETPRFWESLPAHSIITPHSGEMSRLTGLSTREIQARRWDIASQCASDWGLTIVLKGAHTLIAAPDGRTAVIPFKTDALGTAGTGDVLAGLMAGLRAQGLAAFEAAALGAYVHAAAGMMAAERVGSSRSVVAGDVLASLGAAFARIEAV